MNTQRFMEITREYLEYDRKAGELMEQRQTLLSEQPFDNNGFPLLNSLEQAGEYRRLNKAIRRCEAHKDYVTQTAIIEDFPEDCWIKVDGADAGTGHDIGLTINHTPQDQRRLLIRPWNELLELAQLSHSPAG